MASVPTHTRGGGRYPRSVGLLGAGYLATVVAERLRQMLPASTQVVSFARDPEVRDALFRLGVARAASPADLAARSEMVLALADRGAEVEAQFDGPSGLQAGVHSATLMVITTAFPPNRLRPLAHRVLDQTAGRLRLIDAPLSGPRSAVLRGELSIPVGAPAGGFAEVEPVLALLGRPIRVGGIGTAQVAHACEQLVRAATAMGLSEATMIAERAGLDTGELLSSWARAGVPGRILEAARAQLSSRSTTADLPARVMATPLTVAADEADRIGVRAGLVAQLRELGERLDDAGLSDYELSAAYRILAAHRMRPPGREVGISGELQDDNHQDDDHQHANDGPDNSSVHGQPSSPAPDADSLSSPG